MSIKIFKGRIIDAPTPKEIRVRENTYIGIDENGPHKHCAGRNF